MPKVDPELETTVLAYLYDHPGTTKKEISKCTDYSFPTITKGIEALLGKGLIRKRGVKDTSAGRKPSIYEFDGSNYFFVGIDLSIPKFTIALFDLSKRLVASGGGFLDMEAINEGDHSSIPGTLIKHVKSLINRSSISDKRIKGLGVGVPGIVRKGAFKPVTRFETEEMVPLRDPLQKELGFPVTVGNDVDQELLSVLDYKGLKNESDIVAVYLAVRAGERSRARVNIGGSIYHNGHILQGRNGTAGEFGHTSVNVRLEEDLPDCKCGNKNCLDNYVNTKISRASNPKAFPSEITRALNQKIKDLLFIFNPSLLVVDMEAFPEIRREVFENAKAFSRDLAGELCIEEIEIDSVGDSSMACARGAIINQLCEKIREPSKYAEMFTTDENDRG
ncbi:ROK family transcriptional regulator [Candidatus Bipolaricaulota bacterium]|nr:ROK family transcriptional regulator [Candidatus Bipolaricaulota bacterium]